MNQKNSQTANLADQKMKNEIAVQPEPPDLLAQMIASGATPETLAKMMDIHERWQTEQARKSYAFAMNKCQQEMPAIVKRMENKHTRSKYEDLGELISDITPIYTAHGLSVSFDTETTERENWIRVVIHIIHRDGHEFKRHIDVPHDDGGMKGKANKTGVQAVTSATSYARRYLLKMVFNLATRGEDHDGNRPQRTQVITVDQARDLDFTIEDLNADRDAFYLWAGGGVTPIATLQDFPLDKYADGVSMLKQKYGPKKGGEGK